MHIYLAPVKKKSKHVPLNSLRQYLEVVANSVPIFPCSIQALDCGAVSNPTAAQIQAFSKTCIVQGVQMGITKSISQQKAEFMLFAMRLWHTSFLHPKRNFMLVIVCLNEGALSLPVPCVVAVSVVTSDCIEKEVEAQKSV